MSEEIKCDMIPGNRKRHNPQSSLEAYCYQMHDALQLLYGFSLMQDNDDNKRSALKMLRDWCDLAEEQIGG